MSCERFRESITDHACGAAIDTSAAAHLAVCAACREVFEEHRQLLAGVDADLRTALSLTASPDFSSRVSTRVRADQPAYVWGGGWWIGAAAAAVVAVAAYVSWPIGSPPAGSPVAAIPSPSAVPPRSPEIAPRPVEAPAIASKAPSLVRAGARKAPGPRSDRRVEPEVIVPPTQARAIARLRELVSRGVIDESTLPKPTMRAELIIPPLSVPEIVVPEIGALTKREPVGAAERN
jgi:hypothetical protein